MLGSVSQPASLVTLLCLADSTSDHSTGKVEDSLDGSVLSCLEDYLLLLIVVVLSVGFVRGNQKDNHRCFIAMSHWLVCFGGGPPKKRHTHTHTRDWMRPFGVLSTGRHAYLVTRKAAGLLLEHTLPMYNHGDKMFQEVYQTLVLRVFHFLKEIIFGNPSECLFVVPATRLLQGTRRKSVFLFLASRGVGWGSGLFWRTAFLFQGVPDMRHTPKSSR